MSVSVRHDLCLPRKCDYASCQERGEEASPDSSLPLVPNLARPPKQRKVETRKVETKSRDEKKTGGPAMPCRQCHVQSGALCRLPLRPPSPPFPPTTYSSLLLTWPRPPFPQLRPSSSCPRRVGGNDIFNNAEHNKGTTNPASGERPLGRRRAKGHEDGTANAGETQKAGSPRPLNRHGTRRISTTLGASVFRLPSCCCCCCCPFGQHVGPPDLPRAPPYSASNMRRGTPRPTR